MGRILAFLLLLVVAAAIVIPYEFKPGLYLGGTSEAAPADFNFVNDRSKYDKVMVQTKGIAGLPQVHVIWAVGIDDAIYAFGEENGRWRVAALEAGELRMRVGDAVYDLNVTPMKDASEEQLLAIHETYRAKYNPDYDQIIGDALGREPTPEDMRVAVRMTAK